MFRQLASNQIFTERAAFLGYIIQFKRADLPKFLLLLLPGLMLGMQQP